MSFRTQPPDLDFVMTLVDLRRPGVDFTERIACPQVGGAPWDEWRVRVDVARLQLAAKAATLRDGSESEYDAEDARKFVRQVLDVGEAGQPQAVAHTLLGLTFTAQYRPAVR